MIGTHASVNTFDELIEDATLAPAVLSSSPRCRAGKAAAICTANDATPPQRGYASSLRGLEVRLARAALTWAARGTAW
jgi:hypothetical protein